MSCARDQDPSARAGAPNTKRTSGKAAFEEHHTVIWGSNLSGRQTDYISKLAGLVERSLPRASLVLTTWTPEILTLDFEPCSPRSGTDEQDIICVSVNTQLRVDVAAASLSEEQFMIIQYYEAAITAFFHIYQRATCKSVSYRLITFRHTRDDVVKTPRS